MKIEIQPLNSTHDRQSFDCGVAPLNTWFATTARQQQRKGAATVFVAVNTESPTTCLGLFSLSATEIDGNNVPMTSLPNKVPAILLGRFAVSKSLQGKGLGRDLLMCAFEKVALASQTVGAMFLAVKAKDEKAAAFYSKYGFQPSKSDPLQMFLPVSTITKLLQ